MTSVNLTSLMLEQTYINTLLNKKVDYCLSVHGLGFIEFIIMTNDKEQYYSENRQFKKCPSEFS
jgi:hypothetical protein